MSTELVKVVLVEDDADDIYIFKNELTKAFGNNIVLEECRSLTELYSLETTSVDIIMLDLGLPDSNGINTVVNAVNRFSDIPIVVLTGVNSVELGEQAIQFGAQDYIPKDELSHRFLQRSIRFSIERHALLTKLKNMAHVDTLTLLYNRAYFFERLVQQCQLSNRKNEEFGVIMVDLDGFKEVNDTYGHNVGDQVLEQFSARLKALTRRTDVLARFGGDEFIMILSPLLNAIGCGQVAEAKLKCTEDSFLIFHDGKVEPVKIGMSIGYAMFPSDSEDANGLIRCADKAMYAVKATGKNGVKAYSNLDEQ